MTFRASLLSMPRRLTVVAAVAGLSAVTLTGCISTTEVQPEGSPSAAPSASAAPTPSPTWEGVAAPFEVPAESEGEISRVVFTADGPDGVPTSEVQIFEAVQPGVTYTLEYDCRPTGMPVPFMISWSTVTPEGSTPNAEPAGRHAAECAGPAEVTGLTLEPGAPLQLSAFELDAVETAWARLTPDGS
ncbi:MULTISPECIES: hypothetical protein [unclassified Microbacterium]|uniref:hypothetical protein n=1 Tax=unclassified Microbacterium TaxID=2609290 RepID=UPI00386F9C84